MLCTADLDKLSGTCSEANVLTNGGARTLGGTSCSVESCKVRTSAAIRSRVVATDVSVFSKAHTQEL